MIRLDKVLQTVYLQDLVQRPPHMCIIVSGGVLERVKEWRQLLADITGMMLAISQDFVKIYLRMFGNTSPCQRR